MLTWLDHLCRRCAESTEEECHGGDPRRALARHVGEMLAAVRAGVTSFEDIIEESQYVLLAPFVGEFLPPGVTLTFAVDGSKPPRPLGLLLTRATANLLSAADASNIPDELWRAELGPNRAVYVDIPHGALLLDAGRDTTDVLQLRSILAAPYLPPDRPGGTLFVAQVTDRGSEQGRGRVAGVLEPDGSISRFSSPKTQGRTADWTLMPPHVHPLAAAALLGRAGTFLRLVLAYHFFGPKEAREAVAATPVEKLRGGKPRKDESLFAMTRLNASEAVGRPRSTIPGSWSLTSRQEVAGHFKLQAYGPQSSLRRMIWVNPYERGPQDAPIKPPAHRL